MRNSLPTLLLFTVLGTCGRAQNMVIENVIIITMDGLRWQELFGGAVDSMIDNRELTADQDRMREQYLATSLLGYNYVNDYEPVLPNVLKARKR
ncbi:MAG: hypothetical protein AAFZ52_03875 [Bacteroidota bacterium]